MRASQQTMMTVSYLFIDWSDYYGPTSSLVPFYRPLATIGRLRFSQFIAKHHLLPLSATRSSLYTSFIHAKATAEIISHRSILISYQVNIITDHNVSIYLPLISRSIYVLPGRSKSVQTFHHPHPSSQQFNLLSMRLGLQRLYQR